MEMEEHFEEETRPFDLTPFLSLDRPLAYVHDHETGEYVRSEQCHLDPLETEVKGEAVWMLPADATLTAPESREGFAAVWKDGGWAYVEDHRCEEYWPAGSTNDSQPVEMKELGPLPEGAMLERPALTPEEIAEQERQKAEAEAEAARLPDLEDAVAELGGVVEEETSETQDAVLELAGIVAQLEEEIAALKAAKEN